MEIYWFCTVFFKVFWNCFRFFFPFFQMVFFSKYKTFSLFPLSGEVLKLHIRLNLHHKPGCSNKGTFWMYRMRRWLSKILGTSFIPIPFKHFPFHCSLYRGGHAFGRGENEKIRLRRKVFLLVVCDYSMDPWAVCDLLDGNNGVCVTIPDISNFFSFFCLLICEGPQEQSKKKNLEHFFCISLDGWSF